MTEKIAVLVGAAPINGEAPILLDFVNKENVYIIAVDGGLNYLRFQGITPDYIMGDMDSALEGYQSLIGDVPFTKLSTIKDDTDMGLALKHSVDNGCTRAVIFGGAGGKRMSHTFANVQLMHHYAKQGISVTMYSDADAMTVLVDEELILEPKDTGYVSVYSLTDTARVKIEGLFYEYDGMLTNDYALGQSNEYASRPARVRVSSGAVLVIRGL